MKAITGYLAVTCVSVILAAVAMTGMAPSSKPDSKKSSLQVNIEARNAQLAALDEI